MLAPHRTRNPATTGILTQLSEDTGCLWCLWLTGTDTSSCNQASPLATFHKAWVFDHINPSKCPLGSRGGNYCLAYVRSQMNPHRCAKFGANLSSCLADFPHFFYFCPLGHTGQILILPTTFSRWVCMCVPNLVPIGPQTATCTLYMLGRIHTQTHTHSPI